MEGAKDKVVRSTPTHEIQVFLSPASRRYLEIFMEAEEEAAADDADDLAKETGGDDGLDAELGGETSGLAEGGWQPSADYSGGRGDSRIIGKNESQGGEVRSRDEDGAGEDDMLAEDEVCSPCCFLQRFGHEWLLRMASM